MAINWQDPEVKDRILAAIIASFDSKARLLCPIPLAINCKEVARLFGSEATYDAIENFLRKPKRKAQELRDQAAGRPEVARSPAKPRARKENSTPRKSDGVKAGRVTKTKKLSVSSPIKKEVGDTPIKKEVFTDEDVFGGGGAMDSSDMGMDFENELDNEI
ncbi:hypothetical protein N0V90_001518 [Kalmusia sp. IMI 367209]|nr:hypothetical protein N0V90_001518 [Kalmusia sp. IMI 367209]